MAGCVYAMEIPDRQKIIGRRRITVKYRLLKIGAVDYPERLEESGRPRDLRSQYRTEFLVVCAIEVPGFDTAEGKPNFRVAEKQLRDKFDSQNIRVNNRVGGEGREFFDLTLNRAVSELRKLLFRFLGDCEVTLQKGNYHKASETRVLRPQLSLSPGKLSRSEKLASNIASELVDLHGDKSEDDYYEEIMDYVNRNVTSNSKADGQIERMERRLALLRQETRRLRRLR